MTHDELLNHIVYDDDITKFAVRNALRAVVELHKPDGDQCEYCTNVIHYDHKFMQYPCPTIQAIEKELR